MHEVVHLAGVPGLNEAVRRCGVVVTESCVAISRGRHVVAQVPAKSVAHFALELDWPGGMPGTGGVPREVWEISGRDEISRNHLRVIVAMVDGTKWVMGVRGKRPRVHRRLTKVEAYGFRVLPLSAVNWDLD